MYSRLAWGILFLTLIDQARRSDVTLGPLRLKVVEEVSQGRVPPIEIRLRTLKEYGCSNLRIQGSVERHADTVVVRANGLVRERICDDAVGPATFAASIDLRDGRYLLSVNSEKHTDLFRLVVSKERLQLQQVSQTAQATTADTTSFWRAPKNSFVLYCGTYQHGPEVCHGIATWIEAQPGVPEFSFPQGGRLPYLMHMGTWYEEQHYYTYDSPNVLPKIRSCFRSINARVKEAVGINIAFQTQRGDILWATSARSKGDAHIDPPTRVIDAKGCPPNRRARDVR
jgi:hypothetical protein